MVKITYDDDNKKERELVENYYFYKYYVKSLEFDFKNYKKEVLSKNHFILNIIKNHCNSVELQRVINIHRYVLMNSEYGLYGNIMCDDDLFIDLLYSTLMFKNWYNVSSFKYLLIKAFPYKEDN